MAACAGVTAVAVAVRDRVRRRAPLALTRSVNGPRRQIDLELPLSSAGLRATPQVHGGTDRCEDRDYQRGHGSSDRSRGPPPAMGLKSTCRGGLLRRPELHPHESRRQATPIAPAVVPARGRHNRPKDCERGRRLLRIDRPPAPRQRRPSRLRAARARRASERHDPSRPAEVYHGATVVLEGEESAVTWGKPEPAEAAA
jgi:hypothetical protein